MKRFLFLGAALIFSCNNQAPNQSPWNERDVQSYVELQTSSLGGLNNNVPFQDTVSLSGFYDPYSKNYRDISLVVHEDSSAWNSFNPGFIDMQISTMDDSISFENGKTAFMRGTGKGDEFTYFIDLYVSFTKTPSITDDTLSISKKSGYINVSYRSFKDLKRYTQRFYIK
jgi:hypothetical protein